MMPVIGQAPLDAATVFFDWAKQVVSTAAGKGGERWHLRFPHKVLYPMPISASSTSPIFRERTARPTMHQAQKNGGIDG